MTGVLIRDAAADDMTALSGVYRRSSLSNEGDRPNLLAHPETLEFSELAVQQGRTRAAVAEGEIVGFASWLGAGDAFEIEDLFVEPGWMRRGIGQALVLDMIAIARGRGIGRVEVTANPHALAFYEKAGFVVYRQVVTRFRTAPRMRLDVTVTVAGDLCLPWRLRHATKLGAAGVGGPGAGNLVCLVVAGPRRHGHADRGQRTAAVGPELEMRPHGNGHAGP